MHNVPDRRAGEDLFEEIRRAYRENREAGDRSVPVWNGDRASGRQLGDFRLIRELGRGGMGAVFLAEQLSLRRNVAVKLLPPGFGLSLRRIERFRREAKAVGRLCHPGIVPVFTVGEEGGVHFFAMEHMPGGNLAARLARRDPIDPQWAAGVVLQVAEALQFAHGRAIVHRDVKPQNILFDADGRPRLADFGLAKDLADESLSLTGELAGTADYMSPEQTIARQASLDCRTDVFSLGVVFYEMLAGRRPFRGDSTAAVLHEIAFQEPPRLRRLRPSVPRDLATICAKAMEKDPARRYSGAGELAEDLRRYLHCEPIRARPVGPVGRVARWARRKPALAAVAAALLLAAAGLSWSTVRAQRLGATISLLDAVRRATAATLRGEAPAAADLSVLQRSLPSEVVQAILRDPHSPAAWERLEQRLQDIPRGVDEEPSPHLIHPRGGVADLCPSFAFDALDGGGRAWTYRLTLWQEGNVVAEWPVEQPVDGVRRLSCGLPGGRSLEIGPGYSWRVRLDPERHPGYADVVAPGDAEFRVVDPDHAKRALGFPSTGDDATDRLLRAAALNSLGLGCDALGQFPEKEHRPPEQEAIVRLLQAEALAIVGDKRAFESVRKDALRENGR